jgi:hypothetical protein
MAKPTFYPLFTKEFLMVNGLLKDSELRVWLYFSTLAPFKDSKPVDFQSSEVALILGLSQRTIQRAINRLIQLDLVDIEITKGKIKPRQFATNGGDNLLQLSDKSLHPSDTDVASSDNSRHPSDTDVASNGCKSDGAKVSNSSYYPDYSDYSNCVYSEIQNFENTHTEILKNSGEEVQGNSGQVGQIINVSTEQTNSTDLVKCSGGANGTIKYDSRLGMRPPAPKPKYLIPAGDWLNSNGQLDAAFIRHTAKQWQKSSNASFHQLAIEEVEALVFSHFAKDHDALAVKWEAFTKTSTRHAEAVKLRLDAGIEIGETERLEIVGKTQAIASNKSIPLEQITIGSECEENHQAYRLIDFLPIDESEQIENLKRLASLSSVIGRMPEAKANARRTNIRRLEITPADINEANQWLLDPSLRTAALQWAKNQGFNFDGSEIYQEEF